MFCLVCSVRWWLVVKFSVCGMLWILFMIVVRVWFCSLFFSVVSILVGCVRFSWISVWFMFVR